MSLYEDQDFDIGKDEEDFPVEPQESATSSPPRFPSLSGDPARVQSNYDRIVNYAERAERFEITQRAKAHNAAARKRTAATGAQYQRDESGLLQPVIDSATGQQRHTPRTSPVRKDSQGRPYQVKTDETGRRDIVNPDANAKWEENKDDPEDTHIYKVSATGERVKYDPEEGIMSGDRRLAAESAKVLHKRELAKIANEQADISLKLKDPQRRKKMTEPQRQEAISRRDALAQEIPRPEPKKGFFGGINQEATATAEAEWAAQESDRKAQLADLESSLADDDERGGMEQRDYDLAVLHKGLRDMGAAGYLKKRRDEAAQSLANLPGDVAAVAVGQRAEEIDALDSDLSARRTDLERRHADLEAATKGGYTIDKIAEIDRRRAELTADVESLNADVERRNLLSEQLNKGLEAREAKEKAERKARAEAERAPLREDSETVKFADALDALDAEAESRSAEVKAMPDGPAKEAATQALQEDLEGKQKEIISRINNFYSNDPRAKLLYSQLVALNKGSTGSLSSLGVGDKGAPRFKGTKHFDPLNALKGGEWFRTDEREVFGSEAYNRGEKSPAMAEFEKELADFKKKEDAIIKLSGLSPENAERIRERASWDGFRQRVKTLGERFENLSVAEKMPFIGSLFKAADLAPLVEIASRFQQDPQSVSENDLRRLKDFSEDASRDSTFWAKSFDIISELPAFGVELYTTAGIATGARKAAEKAGLAMLKKITEKSGREALEKHLTKSALTRLTGKIGAGLVGEAARLPFASPGRITEGTLHNLMPDISFAENEAGEIAATINEPGDSIAPSFFKALGDSFVENASEQSGIVFKKLASGAKERLARMALFKAFAKANPKKPPSAFMKAVQRAGWNGILEEIGEERIGEIGKALLGVEEYKLPTLDQLALEFVSFAIPGMGIHGVNRMLSGKKAEKFDDRYPDGKAPEINLGGAKPLPEKIAAANAQIDSWDPPEALTRANADIERTAARAALKILSGKPVSALVAAERFALTRKMPDGTPRMEVLKGKPVITDGQLRRLATVAPATADMPFLPEEGARQKILAPVSQESSEPSTESALSSPTPAGAQPQQKDIHQTGEQEASSPLRTPGVDRQRVSSLPPLPVGKAGALVTPEERQAAKQIEERLTESGVGAVLAEGFARYYVRREGTDQWTPDRAGDAVAEFERAGGQENPQAIREAITASDNSQKEGIEEIHRAAVEGFGEAYTKLPEEDRKKLDTIIRHRIAPELLMYRGAFQKIAGGIKALGSAGVSVGPGDGKGVTFNLNLEDLLKESNRQEWKDDVIAERTVNEEVAHSANVIALAQARAERTGETGDVLTMALREAGEIWATLPKKVQGYVHKIYGKQGAELSGMEFFRMLLQNDIALADGKFVTADGKVLTEQASPTLLKKLKDVFRNLIRVFAKLETRLREEFAAQGLSKEERSARVRHIRKIRTESVKIFRGFQKSGDEARVAAYEKKYGDSNPASAKDGGREVHNSEAGIRAPATATDEGGGREGGGAQRRGSSGSGQGDSGLAHRGDGQGSRSGAANQGSVVEKAGVSDVSDELGGDSGTNRTLAQAEKEIEALEQDKAERLARDERIAERRGLAVQRRAEAQASKDAILKRVPEEARGLAQEVLEKVQTGEPSYVLGANRERLPAVYIAAAPETVQASHRGESFEKNPLYGGENTRPYHSDKTEQNKVFEIAKPGALDEDAIVTDAKSASDGPAQVVLAVFNDAGGNLRVSLQTAGGNGREQGINLAPLEDQERLAQAWADRGTRFGLGEIPDGWRGYRFLGVFDLRDEAQSREYQKLVDKLNPSQGVVQDTAARADIDAALNIPVERLLDVPLNLSPQAAQEFMTDLVRDAEKLGLDRNLVSGLVNNPGQAQFYIQRLLVAAAFRSKALGEFFAAAQWTSGHTTVSGLIKSAVATALQLRAKGQGGIADAIGTTLERIAERVKAGRKITLAIRDAAEQMDMAADGPVVQQIAGAIARKVAFHPQNKRGIAPVDSEETQAGFDDFFADMARAIGHFSAEPDLLGAAPTIAETITAGIEAHFRKSVASQAASAPKQVQSRAKHEARPWGEDFPDIEAQTNGRTLEAHHAYKAAKAGNSVAAQRLVLSLAKEAKVRALAARHPQAIVVPVHAQERSGRNKIPRAFADYIASLTGLDADTTIVQSNKAGHTGADMAERFLAGATFEGDVQAGREYILVDDFVTGGGTLADLRNYIEAHGGRVVEIAAMANSYSAQQGPSGQIRIRDEVVVALNEKFGQSAFREFLAANGISGGNAHALTNVEGRWLLRFRSLDAAGNRLAQARRARGAQGQHGVLPESPGRESGGAVAASVEDTTPRQIQARSAEPPSRPRRIRELQKKQQAEGLTRAETDELTGLERAAGQNFFGFFEKVRAAAAAEDGSRESVVRDLTSIFNPQASAATPVAAQGRFDFGNATLIAPAQIQARAFHATPHEVDEFSLAKIGTGEGMQAYGWGLYFAESEKISGRDGYYDKKFSKGGLNQRKVWESQQRTLKIWRDFSEARPEDSRVFRDEVGNDAIRTLSEQDFAVELQNAIGGYRQTAISLDGIPKDDTEIFDPDAPANIYTVDLDVDDVDLLDWGSYEQSPKVREALGKIYGEMGFGGTGENIYKELSRRAGERFGGGTPEAASRLLEQAGIPGIRYLDGQSRNRPLKDIKRSFLDALPENAEFDDVLSEIEKGTFNPDQVRFLRALEDSDWLGFDYPAQAISAALSPDLSQYDASQELIDSIPPLRGDATHNYVIFDESKIKITHKNGEAVTLDEVVAPAQIQARGAEPSANDESAAKQFADVERANADVLRAHDEEGKPLPAPNGRPSKLNRRQWVQVRTPLFKRWFGDWEALARGENDVLVIAVSNSVVAGEKISEIRNDARNQTRKWWGTREPNADLGADVLINRDTFDHMMTHPGAVQIHAALHIPEIIRTARKVSDEAHIPAIPEISRVHRLVSAIEFRGAILPVEIVVKQHAGEKGHHAYDVEAIRVKSETAEKVLPGGTQRELRTGTSAVSTVKLNTLTKPVNPDSVSKVVDENGEPLVVYHGTDAEFDVFDKEKTGGRGFYFAKKKDFAGTYAKGPHANIVEAFVRINNPITEERFNATGIEEGISKSGTVDFVSSNGHDGIIGQRVIVAFDSHQIKSATDNEGMFSESPSIIQARRKELPVDGSQLEAYLQAGGAPANVVRQESERILRNLEQYPPGGVAAGGGYTQGDLFAGAQQEGFGAKAVAAGERSARKLRADDAAPADPEARRRGLSPDLVRGLAGDWEALAREIDAKGSASSIFADLVERKIPSLDVTGTRIEGPRDVAALMQPIRSPYFESLKVMVLDGNGTVSHSQIIHVGSLNEAVADPKAIFASLARMRETSGRQYRRIIISHNHPSGDPAPSQADIRFTGDLQKMAQMAGWEVADHVITNGKNYFSFRENGTMEAADGGREYTPRKDKGAEAPPLTGKPAPWEAVERHRLANIDDYRLAGLAAKALRNANPEAVHVLYLTTSGKLTAIERMSAEEFADEKTRNQKIFTGVAREGALGVIVNVPGEWAENRDSINALERFADAANFKLSDAFFGKGFQSAKVTRLMEAAAGAAAEASSQKVEDGNSQLSAHRLPASAADAAAAAAEAAADGEKHAARRFHENLPLAMHIASKFTNIPGVTANELQQQARLALADAARNFDAARGKPFAAMAGVYVRNRLRSLYRSETSRATRFPMSLDEPLSEGDPETHGDYAEDTRTPSAVDAAAAHETRRMLDAAIASLPVPMQKAVRGFYEERTLEEIGRELGGVSKQRVGVLQQAAFRRLRGKLGEQGVAAPEQILARGAADDMKQAMPDADQAGQPAQPASNETSQEAVDAVAFDGYRDISDEIFSAIPRERADQSRAFQVAAKALERRGGSQAGDSASGIGQEESLAAWAAAESRLIPAKEIDDLPVVSSSTSEHEVHYREADGRAVKRTWPGFYGQVPVPERGRLGRKNASPAEYLRRQALQVAVFGSDIRLEGISISDKPSMIIGQPAGQPSLVISQDWLEGVESPTLEQIEERLHADGFEPVPGSYFGWYRPTDGVVLVDAKPDNFLITDAGIVPLDLQMAVFTPMDLKQAGLEWVQAATNHLFHPESREPGDGSPQILARSVQEEGNSEIDDLLRDLDAEINDWQQAALAEEAAGGWKTVGRPDLAHGADNADVRGVDQFYTDKFEPETEEAWEAEAQAMVERDFDGTRKAIQEAGLVGRLLSAAQIKAADIIAGELRRRMLASGEAADRTAFNLFWYSRRAAGSEWGRAGRAMRDPFKTPAERHREFLLDYMTKPREKAQKEIDAAPSESEKNARIKELEAQLAEATRQREAERVKRIQAELALEREKKTKEFLVDKETAALLDKLKAAGITPQDVLQERVALSLLEKSILKEFEQLLARSKSDVRRMAFALIRRNRPFEEIAKKTGLPEAEVRKIKADFVATMRADHFRKFLTGARADAPSVVTGRRVEQTAAEREFAKWLKKMGFVEDAEQGRPKFSVEDPAHVVRMMRAMQAARGETTLGDMAYEWWIMNILSGIKTHVANITGNAASAALDMTLQRGMEAAWNTIFRDAKAARFGEFRHLLSGIRPGFAKGITMAAKAWSAEHDFFESTVLGTPLELDRADKLGGTKASIPGRAGKIIRIPGKALLFMDSLFKTSLGQMEAGAQAYRIAKGEGLSGAALERRVAMLMKTRGEILSEYLGKTRPSKDGAEYFARGLVRRDSTLDVEELVEDTTSEAWERAHEQAAYDAAKRDGWKDDAWQSAVKKARELTFQQDLLTTKKGGNVVEDLASKLQDARYGNKLAGFFFPFVRTPYNIFRVGLRKSPLGTLNLLNQLRKGLWAMKNGTPYLTTHPELVRDLAEQTIAWVAMALLWGAAQGDDDDDDKLFLITGSSPRTLVSRGERDLNARTTGGDYVIRIGGRNGMYINYGRIEPIATVLGATVDMIRGIKRQGTTRENMAQVWNYIVANVNSKSFLQGLENISALMEGRDDPVGQVKRMALQALVPNLIRQPLRSLDDYVRDGKLAGLEYELFPTGALAEPKINPYGEAIRKGSNPVLRLFFDSPLEANPTLQQTDKALLRWNRHNPNNAWAPQEAETTYKNRRGQSVQMTAEEARKYRTIAGRRAVAKLRGIVTPLVVAHPTEKDIQRIRDAFADARREAREYLFGFN